MADLPAQDPPPTLSDCPAACASPAPRQPGHLSLPLLPAPARGTFEQEDQSLRHVGEEKGPAGAPDRLRSTAACSASAQPATNACRRSAGAGQRGRNSISRRRDGCLKKVSSRVSLTPTKQAAEIGRLCCFKISGFRQASINFRVAIAGSRCRSENWLRRAPDKRPLCGLPTGARSQERSSHPRVPEGKVLW